jgi:hypothetical protein
MMPKVTITAELADTLHLVDEAKARIEAKPVPDENTLRRREAEFIEETVYHGMRLDAYMEGKG